MVEGLESPDSLLPIRTLPGASAKARLDVMAAMTTVVMRLSLNGFDCTTTTGHRKPGLDPAAGGREAHQISPRLMAYGLGLGTLQGGIDCGHLNAINGVEPLRNSVGSVSSDILGDGFRIETTAGLLQALGKMLRRLEDGIRE